MYSGYTYPKTLAGLVGLSCWICLYKQLPKVCLSVCMYTSMCVCVCVCVSPLMVVVQVGPQVPTPLPWAWYSPTCGVLALPQVDLSALALSARVFPRHPNASLGRRDRLVAVRDFALCVCVCECVCM